MTDWTQRIGPGKLCRLEAKYGDPVTAFEYFTMAIRNYLDSGNPTIRVSMAALAVVAWAISRSAADRRVAT